MRKKALLSLCVMVAAFGLTFIVGSTDAEARCRRGWWLNSDGTCTPRGRVNCIGTGKNCPAGTQCVRRPNGTVGCRRR